MNKSVTISTSAKAKRSYSLASFTADPQLDRIQFLTMRINDM
jgi:hypothetical protein